MSSTEPVSLADDVTLALRLKALSHPARVAIVRALARSERCCCGDIVRPLSLAQSTVSQHLKILREAGLIRGESEGVRSNYRLDHAAFAEVAAMVGRLVAEIDAGPDRGCGRRGADEADADGCCRDGASDDKPLRMQESEIE